MSVTLHTEPTSLPRSLLEQRFKDAIAEVERRQRGDTTARGVIDLDDRTRFLPDGEDAKAGSAGLVIGAIAAVFGLAFVGMVVDGTQAQPWMRFVGPTLAAGGGYLAWRSHATSRTAKTAPRITGIYLFDDVLVHVATYGCRRYPIERVRGFEYRSGADDRSARLLISFVDDAEVERQDVLVYEDVREVLQPWLARKSV